VCEEHCPISDKAIYTIEVEVQDHDGTRKKVKQPHVDPSRCIGCGICENVCPLKERPAVRVASTNETRRPGQRQVINEDSPY
jgi:formate hydrogenlyase subunit 6/NADH:ubiquinone oxidoreductase subunit I